MSATVRPVWLLGEVTRWGRTHLIAWPPASCSHAQRSASTAETAAIPDPPGDASLLDSSCKATHDADASHNEDAPN